MFAVVFESNEIAHDAYYCVNIDVLEWQIKVCHLNLLIVPLKLLELYYCCAEVIQIY